jgi:hypothetical protein
MQVFSRGMMGFLFLGAVLWAGEVGAQTTTDFAGTWTLVSAVTEQGGKKTHIYGANPKGSMTVDAKGRYALVITRARLPRIASDNRMTATPEENRQIVEGSLAHFGTLSVNAADKTFTFKIEAATFPNWNGTEQRRRFTLSGDTLEYTLSAASGGGNATAIWKRAR